jgi:ribosomal protein L29
MEQFKIDNLRKLDDNKLKEILEQVNRELVTFKSATMGYAPTTLPKGKHEGTIDWGRAKQLKKAKARILTLLNERKNL